MKKTKLLLMLPMLSLILLTVSGCEKEDDNPLQPSFITITATIVEENSDIRTSLTESDVDGKMDIRWKDNDELQLCFIHNGTPYKRIVNATGISGDGKQATFKIELPEEITTGSFDLYGVLGGAGLKDDDPLMVKLYDNNKNQDADNYSLQYIQDNNIPVLKFERKGIAWGENQSLIVRMEHLGWLQALHVKNNSGKELILKPSMVLHSDNSWIYPSENNVYDLVNNKFTINPVFDCSWTSSQTPLQNEEIRTYWQWVSSSNEIPDLTLVLYDGVSNEPFAISGNTLRDKVAKNGDVHHFWVQFESEKVFNFTYPFTNLPSADISNGGDPYFTMDDITFWVGTGMNKAALVLEWHDGKYPDALVWGYKWDGVATGFDMFIEIAKADPLLIAAIADQWGGKIIGGVGYNINKTKEHYLIFNNENDKPKYPENSLVEANSTDLDNISYSNPSGHWQSGWYTGYWCYWVKDNRVDAWEYSSLIATLRELQDGSWDGWSFLDDMNEWNGRPLGNEFIPASHTILRYKSG